MSKSLLLFITLVFSSYNLFSQRLCEETLYTAGLHQSVNPNEIIIKGNNKLYWYNAESCEFVDTLDPKVGSAVFRISLNADCVILTSFNPDIPLEFVKYDLLTKEKVDGFNITSKSEYAVDLAINDYTNSFYILSDNDNKITEYNLQTGEEIRSVSTPSPGLSEIKVSSNGTLIGVYSPWKDFGNILHIYDAHTLEFIRSINFRDYFEELDIQINSGFEFDPVSNDIYLGSDKKLIRYDFENKQTTTILDQYRINSSNMNFSESGDTLIVDFKPDGVNTEIGIVNTNAKDEFYTLPGFSLWAIPFKNYLIVGNDNFSKNIFKLSLLTGVEEQYQGDINLYPNPNSGNLTIEINNMHPSQIEIKLYDIQGALILDLLKEFMAEYNFIREFSLGSLSNGTYLVEIKINEERFIEELILEK